jgi:hypothetical protein
MSRLLEKVEVMATGCHEFRGCTTKGGYGMLRVGSKTDGTRTMRGAHVIAWEHHHGRRVPKGMVIMHTECDNPRCVNPDHLTIGTQKDNVLECRAKGRAVDVGLKGESNGSSKLTEKAVVEIRKLFKQGASKMALARKYKVSDTVIRKVVNMESWKHVGGYLCPGSQTEHF